MKKTVRTHTFQELYHFVLRADTEKKKKIAHKWLYDHVEDEDDYNYLVAVLQGLA